MRADVASSAGAKGAGGAGGDSVSTTAGFRTTAWTGGQAGATAPFELNGQPLKFRGFSHHNSIGGLGVAISERVELFRVQASRALGSNIWRMSHNPYQKPLYDLLDATGVMCWDGACVRACVCALARSLLLGGAVAVPSGAVAVLWGVVAVLWGAVAVPWGAVAVPWGPVAVLWGAVFAWLWSGEHVPCARVRACVRA